MVQLRKAIIHQSILTLVYFLFLCNNIIGQETLINGHVMDSLSNEPLIGVLITNNKKWTYTDDYGYFILKMNVEDTLLCSHLGYERELIVLEKETQVLLVLLKSQNSIEEIVISDKNNYDKSINSFTGAIFLDSKKAAELPVLFGENDVIKYIQSYAGVQAGQEGKSSFYVRGGLSDENLILLDGIPVYNTNHLLGLVSIFNTNTIKSATLHKNYIRPKFTGRLSSVLDMKMKEGSNTKTKSQLKIGTISSDLTLEGPIIKNRLSYFLSTRLSTLNYLLNPILRNSPTIPTFTFNDWNAKVNFSINKKSSLFVSTYSSHDNYAIQSNDLSSSYNNGTRFSSKTNLIRYNLRFNKSIKAHLLIGNTIYKNRSAQSVHSTSKNNETTLVYHYNSDQSNSINDLSLNAHLEAYFEKFGIIQFGLKGVRHQNILNNDTTRLVHKQNNDTITNLTTFGVNNLEKRIISSMFLDYTNNFGKIQLNGGINVNYFQKLNLEPRLRLSANFNKLSINASYQRNYQYLHLFDNEYIGIPVEQWILSDEFILPKYADQFNIGFSRKINSPFFISGDIYYKKSNNIYLLPQGINVNSISNIKEELKAAEGISYGIELTNSYSKNRWDIDLFYTLSWSRNRFYEKLGNFDWFPTKNDRRHVITFNGLYRINKKSKLSFAWNFNTGNSYTFHSSRYILHHNNNNNQEPTIVNHIDSPNNVRLPSYHRADIAYSYTIQKKLLKHEFGFNIYNLYSRRNPYFLRQTFNFDTQGQNELSLEQFSLFPILPSFHYKLSI